MLSFSYGSGYGDGYGDGDSYAGACTKGEVLPKEAL